MPCCRINDLFIRSNTPASLPIIYFFANVGMNRLSTKYMAVPRCKVRGDLSCDCLLLCFANISASRDTGLIEPTNVIACCILPLPAGCRLCCVPLATIGGHLLAQARSSQWTWTTQQLHSIYRVKWVRGIEKRERIRHNIMKSVHILLHKVAWGTFWGGAEWKSIHELNAPSMRALKRFAIAMNAVPARHSLPCQVVSARSQFYVPH